MYPRHAQVYVDESHKTKGDCQRKYGYHGPKKRSEVVIPQILGHGEPVSAIAGIAYDGIVNVDVFDVGEDGNIDAEIFLNSLEDSFFKDYSNIYNPFHILPLSVYIFDNARTHDKYQIDNLCSRYGVVALYLPPYSYDFNPIETHFSTSKTYLQSHYHAESNLHMRDRWENAIRSSS